MGRSVNIITGHCSRELTEDLISFELVTLLPGMYAVVRPSVCLGRRWSSASAPRVYGEVGLPEQNSEEHK